MMTPSHSTSTLLDRTRGRCTSFFNLLGRETTFQTPGLLYGNAGNFPSGLFQEGGGGKHLLGKVRSPTLIFRAALPPDPGGSLTTGEPCPPCCRLSGTYPDLFPALPWAFPRHPPPDRNRPLTDTVRNPVHNLA